MCREFFWNQSTVHLLGILFLFLIFLQNDKGCVSATDHDFLPFTFILNKEAHSP